MSEKHFVYILLTEKNTLYCGYTDNVEKRFKNHIEGKGAKYTKANKPLKIVWQKEFETKSEALRRECEIKKLKRREKERLIYGEKKCL